MHTRTHANPPPSSDDPRPAGLSDAAFSQALDHAYEHQYRMLLGLALRMLGNGVEAEDCVQEAFETAWRRRETFRGDAKLSTWLYRVCANCALMRLRSQRRSPLVLAVNVPDMPSLMPAADTLAAGQQHVDALSAAFQTLPLLDRNLLMLRAEEGLESEALAQRTGLTAAAVRTRMSRAREKLKRSVADMGL